MSGQPYRAADHLARAITVMRRALALPDDQILLLRVAQAAAEVGLTNVCEADKATREAMVMSLALNVEQLQMIAKMSGRTEEQLLDELNMFLYK